MPDVRERVEHAFDFLHPGLWSSEPSGGRSFRSGGVPNDLLPRHVITGMNLASTHVQVIQRWTRT